MVGSLGAEKELTCRVPEMSVCRREEEEAGLGRGRSHTQVQAQQSLCQHQGVTEEYRTLREFHVALAVMKAHVGESSPRSHPPATGKEKEKERNPINLIHRIPKERRRNPVNNYNNKKSAICFMCRVWCFNPSETHNPLRQTLFIISTWHHRNRGRERFGF